MENIMASKRFEKGSEEFILFQDFWKICQSFWIPEDNDEYWEQVVNETDDFYKKYKETNEIFVREIVLAFINSLEKRLKIKKNDGKRKIQEP